MLDKLRIFPADEALSRDHLYSLSGPTRYVFFIYMYMYIPMYIVNGVWGELASHK